MAITYSDKGDRVMELLVLANSRKTPARCIAGVNKEFRFKRPVPNPQGEAVPVKNTMVFRDGALSPLRPLDVISIKYLETGSKSHHKEDIVCDMESIQLERTATIDKVRDSLHRLSNEDVWFLRKPQPKIDAEFYDKADMKAASLGLLELRDFTVLKESTPTGKPRIEFKYLGELWNLPVTDNYFVEQQEDRTHRYSHGFVCFSIGDEYQGFHYKLAAGIVVD